MKTQKLRSSTIHEQLEAILKKEINDKLQPGDRIESVSQLAKRFGISPLTVRIALATLSQEGLIERRPGSGCYVLDHKTDKPVGLYVAFDVLQPQVSHFFRQLVGQLRSTLESAGWRLQLYIDRNLPHEEFTGYCPGFLEDIQNQRLAGLVAIGLWPMPGWTPLVEKHKIPVVGVEFDTTNHRAYQHAVVLDYPAMVTDAIRYILQTGRRRIAILSWSAGKQWFTDHASVVRQLLEEHQVELRPHWISGDLHPNMIGAGWEEFREIWAAYPEKPDALLVCDDLLFRDVVPAIMELGIQVPDQLLIVTHANKGASVHCPFPVVRMEYDPDAVAATMAEMLVKLMQGERPAESHINIHHQCREDVNPREQTTPSDQNVAPKL
ncbi:MAG: HTH-type transcriptional repressor PurR [Verrucomicrobiae bacterium]|nr:HTH-type transcriptional repressor PurR [Verrucomicrobiae bacterium]